MAAPLFILKEVLSFWKFGRLLDVVSFPRLAWNRHDIGFKHGVILADASDPFAELLRQGITILVALFLVQDSNSGGYPAGSNDDPRSIAASMGSPLL